MSDLPTVAALYVQKGGAYFGLDGVDPWDEERDARLYDGPWPVVAHPPCTRWSILGSCRGYRDGEDDGCFEAALASVREFGGVLEHPRYSLAWERFGLARPGAAGWHRQLLDDAWTCEIDQRNYGLPFRKPTWLYYTGDNPPALIFGNGPRGHVTANNAHNFAGGNRSSTPDAFRDVLLAMARSVTLDVERATA